LFHRSRGEWPTLDQRVEDVARAILLDSQHMADSDFLANQKTILANQKTIIVNQKVIVKNQETIKKNQTRLDLILKNQVKILALLKK
jgi:hypothetical protein